jgi:hypothetical protein
MTAAPEVSTTDFASFAAGNLAAALQREKFAKISAKSAARDGRGRDVVGSTGDHHADLGTRPEPSTAGHRGLGGTRS